MSSSFIAPAGPNFTILPPVFAREAESINEERVQDIKTEASDLTNTITIAKELAHKSRNIESSTNPIALALEKYAQLNQLFYMGSGTNHKFEESVIQRAVRMGFLSRDAACKHNDDVAGIVSVLKTVLNSDDKLYWQFNNTLSTALQLNLIKNYQELRILIEKGKKQDRGVSIWKHSEDAINNNLIKNILDLKMLLNDLKKDAERGEKHSLKMQDLILEAAIKKQIVKDRDDFRECIKDIPLHALPKAIQAAIEYKILIQESDVQEYIDSVNENGISDSRSFESYSFNSILLTAYFNITAFKKPDFSIPIKEFFPHGCSDLFIKMILNKYFTAEDEFNNYIEILKTKVHKDLTEGDEWTKKTWKEITQVDEQASEEFCVNAITTKMKAIAYACGVIKEKPDLKLSFDENICWKGTNDIYLSFGDAMFFNTERVKDKDSLDRYIGNIKNKQQESYNTIGITLSAVVNALKSGVIENADDYCDEILKSEGVIGCSQFIKGILDSGYKISQSKIEACLIALEQDVEKFIQDPYFINGGGILGETEKYDRLLELLLCSIENGETPLRQIIDDLKLLTNEKGLPPLSFNATLENLKQTINLKNCEEWRESSGIVFEAIRGKNEKAIRPDQKIDTETLEMYLASGLANMFAISEPVTGKLLEEHLYKRGYLPIVKNIFERLTFLKPQEVQVLRDFYSKNETMALNNPNFLVDLSGYIETYRKLGLSFTDLQIDLMQDASSLNEVSNRLGQTVIKKLCAPDNLNINVDLEKYDKDRNFHDEWDLKHLGLLISKKDLWNEEQTRMFSLLLKGKFEGTLKGLVYPPDFCKYKPEIYGADEKTTALVERIRYHNLNLLYEMEKHGLKIEPWLNPNQVVKPEVIVSAGTQRTPNDMVKDFQIKYHNFKKWFENACKEEEFLNKLNLRGDPSDDVRKKQEKIWEGVEAELKPILSKKDRSMKGTVLQFQELQKRHNDIADKFKAKHKLLLDSVSKLFSGENLPEPIADMQIILDEIINYNPKKQDDAKILLVHFGEGDPGFDTFLGNYAGSCTALDKNATAIFQFLLDIGTLYVPISELENNDYTGVFDETNYTPKGYARIFPAVGEDDLPTVFIDSTDGKEAHVNFGKVKRHIDRLADAIGIDKNKIIDRLKSKENKCKDKIGGVISSDYFHHFGKDLQPRVIDTERKAILDKWAQEKGWI